MSRVFEHSVIDWVGFRADSLVIANTNGGAAMLSQLMMIGMIFVIFYFLLIRPQQKEQKAHTALLMGLQKGDKVATARDCMVGFTRLEATLWCSSHRPHSGHSGQGGDQTKDGHCKQQ